MRPKRAPRSGRALLGPHHATSQAPAGHHLTALAKDKDTAPQFCGAALGREREWPRGRFASRLSGFSQPLVSYETGWTFG